MAFDPHNVERWEESGGEVVCASDYDELYKLWLEAETKLRAIFGDGKQMPVPQERC